MKYFFFLLFTAYSLYFIYFAGQPRMEMAIFGISFVHFFLEPLIFKEAVWHLYTRYFLITISAALMVAGHIQYFLIQSYKVSNKSMMPLLQPGDLILVEKASMGLIVNYFDRETVVKRLNVPWQRNPEIGDILIFKQPESTDYLIKRIHSMDNQKYCMWGDNLDKSLDSRVFGCIDKKNIIGRYLLTLRKTTRS